MVVEKFVVQLKTKSSFEWSVFRLVRNYIEFFFYYIFFSVWVFIHKHSPITGLQGKREDISLNPHFHFHPFTDTQTLAGQLLQRAHLEAELKPGTFGYLWEPMLQWVSHKFQFQFRFYLIISYIEIDLAESLKSSVKPFADDTSVFAFVKDPGKSSGRFYDNGFNQAVIQKSRRMSEKL